MNGIKNAKSNNSFLSNPGGVCARSIMAFCMALPVFTGIATLCSAQDGAAGSKPKPNIAVSGCLRREGYGGFALTEAKIDGMGDGAATAAPGAGKATPQAPPKWLLDHAASAGQHVGEKVQVIGVSTWVDETSGGTKAPSSDEAPSTPHIDFQTYKVVSDSCS